MLQLQQVKLLCSFIKLGGDKMSQDAIKPQKRFRIKGVNTLTGKCVFFADFCGADCCGFKRARDYAIKMGNSEVTCHVSNETDKHLGQTFWEDKTVIFKSDSDES